MKNSTRINLIGVIVIGIISLLFFVIPITPAFIISYVFTIIAIIILMKVIATCGKGNNGVPQSYANIYITCGYVLATLIFSAFTYIFLTSNVILPIIFHIAIVGIFSIIFLIIGAGNQYISKLNNQEPTGERKKFVEEKKNYWK